jgi:FKBP-type peptidyl-prolyl cis-trans isomerase
MPLSTPPAGNLAPPAGARYEEPFTITRRRHPGSTGKELQLMRIRSLSIALALVCAALASACQESPQSATQEQKSGAESAGDAAAAPAKAGLESDEQKTIYSMGYELSKMIAPYNLSDKDLPAFQMGLADGVTKKEPAVDINAFGGAKFADLAKSRAAGIAEAEKKAAQPFLEKSAAEPGAKKTESGLIYQEITAGTGKQPTASDQVKVHYTGTLIDGTVFDSSVQRGQPATFPLGNVIKCWTEGLQLMKEGGKAKLICPADIAYGDVQKGQQIKPGSTLVFEVELIEVIAAAAPAPPQGH